MVNLPVGDTLAFRLSGFYDDVPGYIDDPAQGRNGSERWPQVRRTCFHAVRPERATCRCGCTAETQHSTYNGTNLVDVDRYTLKPLYGNLTQERAVVEPSRFTYENYNATIDWNAGPFRVLSTSSYGMLDTYTVTDAHAVLWRLYPGPVATAEHRRRGLPQRRRFA